MEFSSEYINEMKEKIKKHAGMSDIELQREIEALVEELKFISSEAAVVQIARKYGIEANEVGAIDFQEFSAPVLSIADIIEHEVIQPSISVQGVVLRVYRPLEIRSRTSPSEINILARVLVGDGTGSLMVLFWPPHSTLIVNKEVRRGTPLRLRRVSSKKNPRSEAVEIHTTASSEIEIVPELLQSREFPHPNDLVYLPSDLLQLVREQGQIGRLVEFDVLGRVKANYGVRTFTRANQEQGQYGQLILKDESASVRVLFWEERSRDIQDINVGDLIFLEGVTLSINRRSTDGGEELDVTLHVNKLANVTKLNEDEIEENFHQEEWVEKLGSHERSSSPLKDSVTEGTHVSSISELTLNQGNVNLRAQVKKIFSSREFTRRDGTKGYVTRALIHDEKAGIILVAWDDQGKFLETCEEGTLLKIQGARVRSSRNGDLLELHVDNNGMLIREEMLDEESSITGSKLTFKPAAWKDLVSLDGKMVMIRGIVRTVFGEHVFERSGGGRGKNRIFLLYDKDDPEQRQIRVIAWNEKVDELSAVFEQLGSGDEVEVTWARVKIDERYEGSINLHLRSESEIHILHSADNVAGDVDGSAGRDHVGYTSKKRSLQASRDGRSTLAFLNGLTKGQTVECRVMITRINSRKPYYMACPRVDCQKKLVVSETDSTSTQSLSCPVHGTVSDPEIKLVISGEIDDGTARCEFVGFGKISEQLLDAELVAQFREMGLSGTDETFSTEVEQWLRKVRSLVEGKQFLIKGYVVESRSIARASLDSSFEQTRSVNANEAYQVILTWASPLRHDEAFELITEQLI